MSDLAEIMAELQAASEQLAAYKDAVGDAVRTLGHDGCEPVDLFDALGQVVALLDGKDSLERADLQGVAERVRAVLYADKRTRELLESSRGVCERRTAERDEARSKLQRTRAALLLRGHTDECYSGAADECDCPLAVLTS